MRHSKSDSAVAIRSLPLHLMLAIFLFAVTVFGSQDGMANEPSLPNIVLIMADDFGWKDLHCYGNEKLDTPNLDRLARQGMRFTDGYAASPVCTPTRAAIMTGMSPARLAITNHAPGNGERFHLPNSDLQEAEWTTYLDLEYETIAERLQNAGYATGFVGKWHLSHRPGKDAEGNFEPRLRPQHQGYQLNVGGCSYGGPPSYFSPYKIPALESGPEGEYLPERLADECISFVDENKDRPFFLTWWNYSVHYPFEARQPLIEKYEARKGPGVTNPTYAAMIEGMDQAIGRFLDHLDTLQLTENTLVIFTSDNGAWGTDMRPLRGQKGHLWEGGIRVPWIIRWPGKVKPDCENATPIISTDIFPTLLKAAGLKPRPDQPLDGVSLLPLFSSEGRLKREALFFHYPNYAFHKENRLGSAIRVGNYKLILRFDDHSTELYDLSNDIGESINLATSKPDLNRQLRSRLLNWLEESNAKLPVRISSPDNEYATSDQHQLTSANFEHNPKRKGSLSDPSEPFRDQRWFANPIADRSDPDS